jgi:hypothetical protein
VNQDVIQGLERRCRIGESPLDFDATAIERWKRSTEAI